MTSKNLFFKLMREDLKRRLWAASLAFLLFFFCFPVSAAMGCAQLAKEYASWIKSANSLSVYSQDPDKLRASRLVELCAQVTGLDNYIALVIIIGAALVLGLTGFLYLHSRKQVDFYHSIPVRREVLFAVRYLDGFLIVAFFYLINFTAALAIFFANGMEPARALGPAFTATAVHAAGFLLCYGLMILATLLTGNFFISVLGGGVLFFYGSAAALLVTVMQNMFYMTICSDGDLTWWELHGSPIIYYVSLFFDAGDKKAGIGGRCLVALLIAAVFAGIALLLHRLRPSEAAGHAISFERAKAPIKILLVVPCTVMSAIAFWTVYYSLPWLIFGFAAGLLLSHCLIEIIYHFDFRKLFANLHHMVICAVLAAAWILVFRFDVLGYDRFFPEEKDFASASCFSWSIHSRETYGIPILGDASSSWRYLSPDDYAQENMVITDYAAVRKLAEAGIAEAANRKERTFANGADQEDSVWYDLFVTYRLKNGKTCERRYEIDVLNNREALAAIYDSAAYKEGTAPIMKQTSESIVGIYVLGPDNTINEIDVNDTLRGQLLSAYQEELGGLTLAERAEANPVAALRFLTEPEERYLSLETHSRRPNYSGVFDVSDMDQINFYAVYPSFTRTLELLKEAGYDAQAPIDPDTVERIAISCSYTYPEDGADTDGFTEETHVAVTELSEAEFAFTAYTTDAGAENGTLVIRSDGTEENLEKIKEILPHLIPANFAQMNGLQKLDTGIEVTVYLKGENENTAIYYLEGKDLPEFLKIRLRYDEADREGQMQYGINGNSASQSK